MSSLLVMVFLFLLFLFVVFVRSSFSSLLSVPLHLSNCLVAHIFIFFSFLAARKEEKEEEEEEEEEVYSRYDRSLLRLSLRTGQGLEALTKAVSNAVQECTITASSSSSQASDGATAAIARSRHRCLLYTSPGPRDS